MRCALTLRQAPALVVSVLNYTAVLIVALVVLQMHTITGHGEKMELESLAALAEKTKAATKWALAIVTVAVLIDLSLIVCGHGGSVDRIEPEAGMIASL